MTGMGRPDWESYFMAMADLVAERSTCPRRHVGAVLVRGQRVIATGYNGAVHGQPHCAEAGCLMVDGHCKRTVHAELNALLQCAAHGIASSGATVFCTASPCLDCAKALIQSGVHQVIYRQDYDDPNTLPLLVAAGITVHRLGDRDDCPKPCVPGMHPSVFVAPGAQLQGMVDIGERASIWYNATLRGDIEPIVIGPESNVQDGVIVHTDLHQPCTVGARVTVGHGAILHGCTVEDRALIGMGAIILSGARIGAGAIVGAGALVTEGQEVAAQMLVLGIPARPVRRVQPQEALAIEHGVDHYIELARRHRA
jgi:dCMP deaminase